jgi:acyl dehydratase
MAVAYMGPEPNWHNDKEIANSRGDANAVVSGQHTLGIVTESLLDFYGLDWMGGGTLFLRFTKEIPVTDSVTLKATVQEVTERDGLTIVTLELLGFGQGDEQDRRFIGTASGAVK